MIKALAEYYNRKVSIPDSGIPTYGWKWQRIHFVVIVSKTGKFVALNDEREEKNPNRKNGATRYLIGKRFLLPQEVVRTISITGNLLWDNKEYAFGFKNIKKEESKAKNGKKREKKEGEEPDEKKKHRAFIEAAKEYADLEEVGAVLKFLENGEEVDKMTRSQAWESVMQEKDPVFTFKVAGGAETVCSSEAFKRRYDENMERLAKEGVIGRCLVTGEECSIAETHRKLSVGTLVSFNNDAFCGLGEKQCYNAPIGKKTMFEYTTALNELLDSSSLQKRKVSDTQIVFWSKDESKMENDFAAIFDGMYTGNHSEESDNSNMFYVLGLSKNQGRAVVDFWYAAPIAEITSNIARWFEDTEIGSDDQSGYNRGINALMRAFEKQVTEKEGKVKSDGDAGDKEVQVGWRHRLGTELVRTAFFGALPTDDLLMKLILEVNKSKGGGVTQERARLIKAILNRKTRNTDKNEKELTAMLDKTNTNIGYNLGRLFAMYEKIFAKANGKDKKEAQKDNKEKKDKKDKDVNLNPGIAYAGKHYRGASSSPAFSLGYLEKMKGCHLMKIKREKPEYKSFIIWAEREIAEIMSKIPSEFPRTLSLADQGRFALGYYHEKDFDNKNKNKGVENEENSEDENNCEEEG